MFMKIRMLVILSMLLLVACGQTPATTAPAGGAVASTGAGSASATTASESSAATTNAALGSSLTSLATTNIAAIDAAVDKNDAAAAKAAFEEFHEGWEAVEDGVRDVSADRYKAIEDAMEAVEDAVVRASTLSATEEKAATAQLRTEIEGFVSTVP